MQGHDLAVPNMAIFCPKNSNLFLISPDDAISHSLVHQLNLSSWFL